MELLGVILSRVFTPIFFKNAVIQGIPLMFGATGETLTEKSGNLNLGIPGIMYMGGIGGLVASFLYEQYTPAPSMVVSIILALVFAFLFAMLGGLIYSVLTISLRANQNVSGLAVTTFGVGFGNFLGGSIMKMTGQAGQVTVHATGMAFKKTLPFVESAAVRNSPVLSGICDMFFSYGFLTYVAILLAVACHYFLNHTKTGLNIRAVGESPATADAASISVPKLKYLSTCIGAGIAGLGGLYFVMEYLGGVWQNNAFGDRGWLAIALVIFARWSPLNVIWGSILFGGLYMLYTRIPVANEAQEFLKMLPYVVTIVVLIITSLRRKREDQPPQSLGLPYFREER